MRHIKRLGTAATVLLLAVLLLLTVSAESAEPRIVCMEGTEEVLSVTTAESGQLTLPQCTPADGAKLVGWHAQIAGKDVFLPAGATYSYQQGENVTFEAVTLHITTAATVTARFDETGAGLRFTTAAALQDMELLATLSPTLVTGTLITTNRNAKAAERFDRAALDAAGKQYLNVVATAYYKTDGDSVTFAGSVNQIRLQNYTLTYAAIGYVTVTYSDGTSAPIYATLEGNKPAAVSPWQMAYAAMTDTAAEQSDRYANAFGALFSPYTEAERSKLQPFFASVIALKVSESVPGGKTLDHAIEAFGQPVYTERVLDESDPEWDTVRPFIDVSKYECTLMITPPEGVTLDATTLSGVVLSLASLPGIAVSNYIIGNGCILLPFSNYSDNY